MLKPKTSIHNIDKKIKYDIILRISIFLEKSLNKQRRKNMKYYESGKNYKIEQEKGNVLEATRILQKQIWLNLITVHNAFAKDENQITEVLEIFNILDYGNSSEMEDIIPIYEKFIGMVEVCSVSDVGLNELLEFIEIDKKLRECVEKKHLN